MDTFTLIKLLFLVSTAMNVQSQTDSEDTVKSYLYNSLYQFDKVIKEKCFKQLGSDVVYKKVMKAGEVLISCIANRVNLEELQEDLRGIKQYSAVLYFLTKYCSRSNAAVVCITSFFQQLYPCLDEDEQTLEQDLIDLTVALDEFVCHKNNHKIALFMSENGLECIAEKKLGIEQCWYIFSNKVGVSHSKVSVQKQCHAFETARICTINEMKTCPTQIPAEVVNELFYFLKNKTSCGIFKKSAAEMVIVSYSVLSAALLLLLIPCLS